MSTLAFPEYCSTVWKFIYLQYVPSTEAKSKEDSILVTAPYLPKLLPEEKDCTSLGVEYPAKEARVLLNKIIECQETSPDVVGKSAFLDLLTHLYTGGYLTEKEIDKYFLKIKSRTTFEDCLERAEKTQSYGQALNMFRHYCAINRRFEACCWLGKAHRWCSPKHHVSKDINLPKFFAWYSKLDDPLCDNAFFEDSFRTVLEAACESTKKVWIGGFEGNLTYEHMRNVVQFANGCKTLRTLKLHMKVSEGEHFNRYLCVPLYDFLEKNETLEVLDLGDCSLTDEVAEKIVMAVRSNPKRGIKKIWFDECPISLSCKDWIQSVLSALDITVSF